ncbi:HNH endonuclease [Burkholderia sp. GS2Y]|uniref:HNH endonuclease n=1 Tax=Burkholderia theae TaxID=3143496 RepID=A0ABU9WKE3_9BURK
MAARTPLTLQKLTTDHLIAAARVWDTEKSVPGFASRTNWIVEVDGRLFPTKALVGLAHSLAGLGDLTGQTLGGAAARKRLRELGFTMHKGTTAAEVTAASSHNFLPNLSPGKRSLPKSAIQKRHVEAAAVELAAEGSIEIHPQPHGSRWQVRVGKNWFSFRKLVKRSALLAGLPEIFNTNLTQPEDRKWRDHLRTLGFHINREEPGRRAPLLDRLHDALHTERPQLDQNVSGDNFLRIELDKRIGPTGVLEHIGERPPTNLSDVAELEEKGVMIRTLPDPVDQQIEDWLTSDHLSTEVKREISVRLGQGNFRSALMTLHGRRCMVTGIGTDKVLRASHIKRWTDCETTPHERLDPQNGLLLCANLDALFEHGLIAFSDDGHILISEKLSETARCELGVHDALTLSKRPTPKQRDYLAHHRKRTGWDDSCIL